MFSPMIHPQNASGLLLPRDRFKPFPVFADRDAWRSLPADIAAKWIGWAEERLDCAWPALPAVRYMDFARNGNRSRYEELYFRRRRALLELVVGECIEGEGRFTDQIVNGIWCLCEESYWVIPAHMHLSKRNAGSALPDVTEHVIDLFAAETGGLLAWIVYAMNEPLREQSDMLVKRVRHELRRRMFEPYLERDDFWWMGYGSKKVNNWNPWIHSNCLAAFLLVEEDEAVRGRAVAKAAESLDFFVRACPPDGCCDEGPGYWGRAGASLFDCLELLYLASDGKLNFYDRPLVREIGKYIYRAHIDGNYFVNFADGNARLAIAADLVYRYGKRIGDERMVRLGAYSFRRNGVTRDSMASPMRVLAELFDSEALLAEPADAPYERDVWLADTQVFVARERAGSAAGLYVAAKGGHNGESHNHNDVGHFIVYYNGRPFLIDAGVESYTSKTFSSRRYEIWTMQSDYHSVPTVCGMQQRAGESYRATEAEYESTDAEAAVSMNLATAYPAEAGIAHWRRTVRLLRPVGGEAAAEVIDSFRLAAASREIVFNLLTLQKPEPEREGVVALENERGEKLTLRYDGNRLQADVERVPITDSKMVPVWGDSIYRLKLKAKAPMAEGTCTVRIEAASSAAR
ncbi:heparinase II/III domain-containing protein [Paenibacillus sp. GYB003]|uniref:heparinase II/III domain-containing protein n=1 Tax=Paenibacillus sp. GYB003 TaxID=2994392 RepID=UPI002F96B834